MNEVVIMMGFLGIEGLNVDIDLVVFMMYIQVVCKYIVLVLVLFIEFQIIILGVDVMYGVGWDVFKLLDIVLVGYGDFFFVFFGSRWSFLCEFYFFV